VACCSKGAQQVALTIFGELAKRVRDIQRSVDELGDFARAYRLAGRSRVGMIPTIAPYQLPKIIENLACLRPELDIRDRRRAIPGTERHSSGDYSLTSPEPDLTCRIVPALLEFAQMSG
jgi:hypothetical protein